MRNDGSVVANLLVQPFSALERSGNHLAQYRFLFLQLCQLLLEVIILLLLVYHP